MYIEYKENIKTLDDSVQMLAIVIGKLETKAIGKLVEDIELPKILERYLSAKEQNIYYRSKYKIKQLLIKEV